MTQTHLLIIGGFDTPCKNHAGLLNHRVISTESQGKRADPQ